jgi:putative ABC transport system substrate-binding protein
MQFGRLKRREFIMLLGGAASWPLAVRGQQGGRLPTIGYLGATTTSTQSQMVAAFVARLHELGWIEGRTVAIEYRWAEGRPERFAEIAAEFARLKVDVIVTLGGAVLAEKQATSVIPIVFAAANDPVGSGLVASLARPGGNITGLSVQSPDLAGKRLELLHEVVGGLRRLAILVNVDYAQYWICARLRQRPVRSASKSPCPKSGERRTSRLPSRRSRGRTRFMSVPTRF